jgi:F-type H+-transporting ATPase subunit delta
LKSIVGREVELRTSVDPDIIGGMVARVGDRLVDGSVITQLNRLRLQIAQ